MSHRILSLCIRTIGMPAICFSYFEIGPGGKVAGFLFGIGEGGGWWPVLLLKVLFFYQLIWEMV
jgi:hypothetical protein